MSPTWMVEACLATRLGLLAPDDRDRLRAALDALGLPTASLASASSDELLAALTKDKKRRNGTVRFALPAAIGTMARGPAGYAREVPLPELLAALEEVRR